METGSRFSFPVLREETGNEEGNEMETGLETRAIYSVKTGNEVETGLLLRRAKHGNEGSKK
jgi:hypothetical protein